MTEKIGFIGLGAMGAPMAKNLIKAGYQLTVYDILEERVKKISKKGAKAAKSCQEVAESTDIVITMVPSSSHVKDAILGKLGVIFGVKEGMVVIDMSTIDPTTTQEISKRLLSNGVKMLDAPVAGGVRGAIEGTLSIFVGGEKKTFEQIKSILYAMGKHIDYIGESGAGQTVKIVNNFITTSTMCVLAEALVLGVKVGVDAGTLFAVLSKSSANSFVLQNHVKNFILKGNFTKVYPIDYVIKDLNLALNAGSSAHIPLYFAALALQTFEAARAAGYGDKYLPAVIRPLEKLMNIEVRADSDGRELKNE